MKSQWGDWYLFGNDGKIQTGVQKWAGTYYYFDPTTYLRVDNDYRQSQWGNGTCLVMMVVLLHRFINGQAHIITLIQQPIYE